MEFIRLSFFAFGATALLSGCIQATLPVAPSDDPDLVRVVVYRPNGHYSERGAVVKLDVDIDGCLVKKKLTTQRFRGGYAYVFSAHPGERVAIAMASDYSFETKLACSVAYYFDILKDSKRYEIGATGACQSEGYAFTDTNTADGLSLVYPTVFLYPMTPSREPDAPGPCIRAPSALLKSSN
jgi:hypothetical protein